MPITERRVADLSTAAIGNASKDNTNDNPTNRLASRSNSDSDSNSDFEAFLRNNDGYVEVVRRFMERTTPEANGKKGGDKLGDNTGDMEYNVGIPSRCLRTLTVHYHQRSYDLMLRHQD